MWKFYTLNWRIFFQCAILYSTGSGDAYNQCKTEMSSLYADFYKILNKNRTNTTAITESALQSFLVVWG